MKRIWLGLLGLIIATAAHANVPCAVPFQLQNGVTADATQVMANYNAILVCLANAAAAGANNDITSLSALSTPLTPAQGGTTVFVGGTSTGSSTVQVVSSVTPTTFSLTAGRQVTFLAGFASGVGMTLNVASSGAVNVFRRSQLGISATVGGEFAANQWVTVEYDGTQYQIVSSGPALVGEIRDYAGSTAPAGYAFIDGSCVSRTGLGADLFSVIGTTYDPTGSTCDTAHFALPDGRGRLLAGQDNMGGSAANRITNAASGCTGTTLGGAGCGSQTHTQLVAELAAHTHAITDPGHVHGAGPGENFLVTGISGNALSPGASFNTQQNTASATTGITINSTAAATAMPILNPLQIVTKIVKY